MNKGRTTNKPSYKPPTPLILSRGDDTQSISTEIRVCFSGRAAYSRLRLESIVEIILPCGHRTAPNDAAVTGKVTQLLIGITSGRP